MITGKMEKAQVEVDQSQVVEEVEGYCQAWRIQADMNFYLEPDLIEVVVQEKG